MNLREEEAALSHALGEHPEPHPFAGICMLCACTAIGLMFAIMVGF